MSEKIVTIVDHVGRNVIGVEVKNTQKELILNNPVILHVQPNPQNGQLQIQSYPYMWMELLKDKNVEQNNWTFKKDQIVLSDVELNDQILSQYKNINAVVKPAEPAEDEPSVIKLFDE